MPEAAVSAETPGAPAFSAAGPNASAGPGTALGAELGSARGPVCGPSSKAKRKSTAMLTKHRRTRAIGHFYPHHDAAHLVPTTPAPDQAFDPAPVTQDFRYLTYYAWSELPPAEKPADIVLSSLKDAPVGTPVEEIKRASTLSVWISIS
jgi:hypothetical protein